MEISVLLIKEGMILESDVYTNKGKFLLSKGIKLTTLLIKKLKSEGIETIDVVVPKKKTKSEVKDNEKIEVKKFGQPDVKNHIDKNFSQLSSTIKSLISNIDVKKDKVGKLTEKLLKFIDKTFDKHNLYILENIVSKKDIENQLYNHLVNVAVLSFMIGHWLGYSKEKIDKLVLAALFHDIGMLKIPEVILNKKEKLTIYEFRDIKKHVQHTKKILIDWNCFDNEIIDGAFHHHERIDGSGYPDRLTGNMINEFSKIIAVADVFDALTSNKPYRQSFSTFKALEQLEKESLNKLDTNITKLFITKFFENYLGQGVKLNNGIIGKIIRLNPNKITRPLILSTTGETYDLAKLKDISIENFL